MGRERRQISRATYRTEPGPQRRPVRPAEPAAATASAQENQQDQQRPHRPGKRAEHRPRPRVNHILSPGHEPPGGEEDGRRTRTTCSTDWERAVGIMF